MDDVVKKLLEMERAFSLADAAREVAISNLKFACLKGVPSEIEEARLKTIETYAARVDLLVKYHKEFVRPERA